MHGVRWGRPDTLFSPAYWRAQAWFADIDGNAPWEHAFGTSLVEEVAACLLGGHGIPAEVGLAAFEVVRASGLLSGPPATAQQFLEVLSTPLHIHGRRVRYRFARQKSRYLSAAVEALDRGRPPEVPHTRFRDWLAAIPGIGPKTASWITRNWLGSDCVAIIDVHVHRAGLLAGFFQPRHRLPNDYRQMEQRFLRFAHAIGVKPALLDALIWRDMRTAGIYARDLVRAPALQA